MCPRRKRSHERVEDKKAKREITRPVGGACWSGRELSGVIKLENEPGSYSLCEKVFAVELTEAVTGDSTRRARGDNRGDDACRCRDAIVERCIGCESPTRRRA